MHAWMAHKFVTGWSMSPVARETQGELGATMADPHPENPGSRWAALTRLQARLS